MSSMELTPEQWERVKALFESILENPPAQRSELLTSANEDQAVLDEVGRLLRSHSEAGNFLSISPLPSPVVTDETTETQLFSPGDLLADRFRITRFIARGGMGEVYEAEDVELREQVALKTIRSEVLEDTHALERFKREVHLAKQVTHPNVCRIFDLFRHATSANRSILLVSMELLRGETLAAHLERVGRMTWPEASSVALQMADGLGAAHDIGILHRDFKPSNVILVQSTKSTRAVITDFGLAVQPDRDSKRRTLQTGSANFGTPAYMSPEQLEGQVLTPASDVYSLGLVLYQMVTGTQPFDSATPLSMAVRRLNETPRSPRTLVPELDRKCDKLILCCLERAPSRRLASANEVAKVIRDGRGLPASEVHGRRGFAWSLAVMALILMGLGGLYYRAHRLGRRLSEKDTIVLADFANTTGDAVFDDTLKTALTVSLRQSPFLNVLSDSKVAKTLKLMTRPPDTKLTPELARELCQRSDSKAYIAGSIAPLGSQYVLALKAVNCRTLDTLAQELATAESKEKVLDALSQATSKLRPELGESLATVEKFDVPLPELTTSSLEALKAYSLGRKALNQQGEAAALPFHQRAIELDPGFAAAYRAVGADYLGMGEVGRASQYYTKAFQLREHTSEIEKLFIATTYYENVTGELDKAAQTYQEEINTYPHIPAYIGLGNAYSEQGEHEKAAEAYGENLRLTPDSAIVYGNLAFSLLALQRFDRARQVIEQAQTRKLDDFMLREALYALAFIGGNSSAIAEQLQWFAGKSEENNGLSLASDTEAYAGHLDRARGLTKRALESAIRADSKETGAIWLENSALREAAFGNLAKAKQVAGDGLKLAPTSSGTSVEAALASAMAGDLTQARLLAQDLNQRFPVHTQMQSLWLPAIHAQIALQRKNPEEALTDLEAASSPIEVALIPFVTNPCLYPTYIRGEAYVAAGQGAAAAAEFRKILDHSGLVWSCWTGALARLGMAQANALEARTSQGADADAARVRALAAYKDFLALWKDADADIPILKQAKAEYKKLE
jgi:serine/threonine protein kinase/tetratricopeptide (TPR) repeat protein